MKMFVQRQSPPKEREKKIHSPLYALNINVKYDSRCSRIICTIAKTQKRLIFDITKHDFL